MTESKQLSEIQAHQCKTGFRRVVTGEAHWEKVFWIHLLIMT